MQEMMKIGMIGCGINGKQNEIWKGIEEGLSSGYVDK